MNSKFCPGVHDPRYNQRNASHVSFLIYLQNKRAHEINLNNIKRKARSANGRRKQMMNQSQGSHAFNLTKKSPILGSNSQNNIVISDQIGSLYSKQSGFMTEARKLSQPT